MKFFLFASLIIFSTYLILGSSPVSAQMGSMMGGENSPIETIAKDNSHGESIIEVLKNILEKQQVATLQELACDQVNDDELEKLGEAFMEQQHFGKTHEVMDQMMGGAGSASLRQMHTSMGGAYLGCNDNDSAGMISAENGVMGGGMMGMMGMTRGNGVMAAGLGRDLMGGYGIFAGLTWIALVSFLLAGIHFFIKNSTTQKK